MQRECGQVYGGGEEPRASNPSREGGFGRRRRNRLFGRIPGTQVEIV